MTNFQKLSAIKVDEFLEKKQNLSYLSWPHAVNILMNHDPEANWVFHDPIMYGETMMVSCTVTAFNKPITMHLPVMDHRNQAVKNPDAVIVNKNMMRCLVKAIACHGLGLSVYAGEDLPHFPDPDTGEIPPPKPEVKEEKPEPKKEEKKPEPEKKDGKAPEKMAGKPGPWQISVEPAPTTSVESWVKLVVETTELALYNTSSADDVMNIFKVNRNIYDRLKLEDESAYKDLVAKFSKTKDAYKEAA